MPRVVTILAAAGAAVSWLIAIPGAAAASPVAARTASVRPAVPGAQAWAKRYNGPGDGQDLANALAVGPDGRTVFVAGSSAGIGTGQDYATAAYNAATGVRRWVSRYNGPGDKIDNARSVAVSPSGRQVFVTGTSYGGRAKADDYATVAYNAATGARLWAGRYNGPRSGNDFAASVTVSPDGGTVFVTGQSAGRTSGADYATVAYNAATGARRWVSRYSGPGNGRDAAVSVAVSPDGAAVFVTGQSAGTTGADYATVAINAATGAQQWLSRYDGPVSGGDEPAGLAVSPTGAAVFVTGQSAGGLSTSYATVAYSAATGAQLWVSRYDGTGAGLAAAAAIAVNPAGDTVYVTGVSHARASGYDYATVAYNAATGAQAWLRRYSRRGSNYDAATSVGVGNDGARVYVTGVSADDYATVGYNAADGARAWVSRYDGPSGDLDDPTALAVSPTAGTVFVTGDSRGATSDFDFATVAYRG